ncbi:eIF-2-alpha kinase activator GCN1 [Castilleja foliolosa]|uniref:EIF-2-alpha kinase activator GCN1 n=1 Tax=Castilleja foliolosa TaxID=1961234 RepID=A0ABD3D5D7_9LAMI
MWESKVCLHPALQTHHPPLIFSRVLDVYLPVKSYEIAVTELNNLWSSRRDTGSVIDSQVPFLPPIEVLVKTLIVIASSLSASTPNAFVQLQFCSHHLHIIGTGKRITLVGLSSSDGVSESQFN